MVKDNAPNDGNVQGSRYPGYGVCIYCGGTNNGKRLFDEHIVPLALNGNAIIKNANCRTCESKIHSADTYLAKELFYSWRLATNADTRNPDERPTSMTFDIFQDGKHKTHTFKVDSMPFKVYFPMWGMPGFFKSIPRDASFPSSKIMTMSYVPSSLLHQLGIFYDVTVDVRFLVRLKLNLFARAIAKIAYCHTVAEIGLENFQDNGLCKAILGQESTIPFFVGSSSKTIPPSSQDKTHTIEFYPATDQRKYHFVKVRLFSSLGSKEVGPPAYIVITGLPKSA